MTAADALVLLVAAMGGYAIGSLPVSAWLARSAGIDAPAHGTDTPGPADLWTLAGPGPGLLAFTADLAKGLLPVMLASVTWTWGTGWAAGFGALCGACWPVFGRVRGGPGLVVLAGVAVALAPAAGVLAGIPVLLAAGVARLAGRSGRTAASRTALGLYPLVFVLADGDLTHLAALMALYLVAAVRFARTRRG